MIPNYRKVHAGLASEASDRSHPSVMPLAFGVNGVKVQWF